MIKKFSNHAGQEKKFGYNVNKTMFTELVIFSILTLLCYFIYLLIYLLNPISFQQL